MKQYDYFISYSTQDEAYVNKIFELLTSKGKTVFKYNRCSNPGNIWEEINNGIDNCQSFLLFPSFDSEQSKAVKRELAIAMHRDVNDDNFNLIPIYLTPSNFLNWALDAQLRIESFDETPESTVQKIIDFIANKTLNYQQPNLPIIWKEKNKLFVFQSSRNIILPTFRFVISGEEACQEFSKYEGPCMGMVGNSSFNRLVHKQKDKNIIVDISFGAMKYVGNNKLETISLKALWFKEGWITDFGIMGLDKKIYRSIKSPL